VEFDFLDDMYSTHSSLMAVPNPLTYKETRFLEELKIAYK